MVLKTTILANDHYRSGENHDHENCPGENLRFGPSRLYGHIVFFELIWISFVSLADIWSYLGAHVIILSIKCQDQPYRRSCHRFDNAGNSVATEVAKLRIVAYQTMIGKFPDVSNDKQVDKENDNWWGTQPGEGIDFMILYGAVKDLGVKQNFEPQYC